MKAKNVYIGPALEALLADTRDDDPDTGQRTRRINNIAERYRALIHSAMPTLTRNEWCAVMDANNGLGVIGDLLTVMNAWMNVADSPELENKWEVDLTRLTARLRQMSMAEKLAVGEAIERFWAWSNLPTDEALAKALVLIG